LDLARYLLEKYKIATLPGSAFGAPERDLSLRVATSYVDMETDEAANAILTAWRRGEETAVFMTESHPQMNAAIGQFKQFIVDLT